MKKLLLSMSLSLGFFSFSHAQCSAQLNDSLLSTNDYVVNAVNVTGIPPFVYSWNITDGNGMPVPYTPGMYGDSVTIDANTLMNSYGCIIFQLCITDSTGCMTCNSDTTVQHVPYPCSSQFVSSIVGQNLVAISLFSTMPPLVISSQYISWTDGNGQAQSQLFGSPTTYIYYEPGPANPSNKFFCCIMTNTVHSGSLGCIACDSVEFTNNTSTAGTGEFQQEKFRIAPNPASSVTQITSDAVIASVKLYNSVGQKIAVQYVLEGKSASFDVGELSKGMYLVEITTENGIFKKQVFKE